MTLARKRPGKERNRAKIWPRKGNVREDLVLKIEAKTGVTTPNQNQGTSPWTSLVFFISHFYRAYKYYFFSLQFSYEHSETSSSFCFHDLLYFQNNECKKKLEIREGSQEQ
jgi:hypothetical protein